MTQGTASWVSRINPSLWVLAQLRQTKDALIGVGV